MTGVSWQRAVMSRAQRTLPSDVYAYVAAGSFDSVTRDEAHAAWQRVRFAPRVLRDVETVDLRTDWLGRQLASPLAIAPTAMQAAIHPDGEVAMAGGIGSGLDALAALGLGADGVLLGRLPLLALAGGGAAAVSDALTRLDAELADALALGGLTTPSDAPTIIARTPPDAR